MTVIEEWNEIQSLESEQISFSISTAVEIGTTTIDSANDITGLDQAFSEIDYNGYGETETDWELLAACRSTKGSADLFFSEELGEIAAAKRICADCPVIAPCLEGALSRGEPCGVWGGQLFSNGRVLAQKRRRGRPPKVARPEDQLPVVPVPAHLQKLIA
ncbi:MAG: WhiB family transcriptional regulator [Acidimicrobiales bacterium]